jgi:YHS domain-containing protein
MDILKKSALIIASALFLCLGIGAGNGACEDETEEAKIVLKDEESAAKDMNNFTCPVSDDDIDKNAVIKVEYKGKLYNLCCEACAEHFKKYPEKFSKKVPAAL